MMWDAISSARKTQLVHIPGNLNATRYRNEILTLHVLPAMNLRREVLPHDNSAPQAVYVTRFEPNRTFVG